MAVRSSALTPFGSHGGVDIVPHHDGGALAPPMTDVPPHKTVPPLRRAMSTSSRNAYGTGSVRGAGGGAGAGVTFSPTSPTSPNAAEVRFEASPSTSTTRKA